MYSRVQYSALFKELEYFEMKERYSSKHGEPLTQQCNVTSQQTGLFNYTTVEISELIH
jgi:hypothetical protein